MGFTIEFDDDRMKDPAIEAAVNALRAALGPDPQTEPTPPESPAWLTRYQQALAGLPAAADDSISLVIDDR